MAYWQKYTFTTMRKYLNDIETFAAANGWTIDANNIYASTYKRVHLHKGQIHCEIYETSSSLMSCLLCTGYSDAAPTSQPNPTTARSFVVPRTGGTYWLVSTTNALYIGGQFYSSSWNIYWSSLFQITDKVGSWGGGFGGNICGNFGIMFAEDAYSSSGNHLNIRIDNEWSPNVVAGGCGGTIVLKDLQKLQPFHYSLGTLPFPVLLYRYNTSDTKKRHPLGYAPELYTFNCGDVYVAEQEIVIGADTYLVLPPPGQLAGVVNNGYDLLFKLGA